MPTHYEVITGLIAERDEARRANERLAGALRAIIVHTWAGAETGAHEQALFDCRIDAANALGLLAVPPPTGEGNGMAAFAGAWPGDETEEQLLATLDYLDGKGPPPAGEDERAS